MQWRSRNGNLHSSQHRDSAKKNPPQPPAPLWPPPKLRNSETSAELFSINARTLSMCSSKVLANIPRQKHGAGVLFNLLSYTISTMTCVASVHNTFLPNRFLSVPWASWIIQDGGKATWRELREGPRRDDEAPLGAELRVVELRSRRTKTSTAARPAVDGFSPCQARTTPHLCASLAPPECAAGAAR